MHHDNNLLQTIRIPKNLLFLTDRLPQANYEKASKKGNFSSNNDVKIKKKNTNTNAEQVKEKEAQSNPAKDKKEREPVEEKKREDERKRDKSPEHANNNQIVINNINSSPPGHGKVKEAPQKEKARIYKDEREKKQHVNKIYQIYSPNSGSQELPNINRPGNAYQDQRL